MKYIITIFLILIVFMSVGVNSFATEKEDEKDGSRKNIEKAITSKNASMPIGVGSFATEKEDENDGSIENIGKATTSENKRNNNNNVDKTPAVFIPSEKVSADQAVAFPIDI
jgi:hypothetical protein